MRGLQNGRAGGASGIRAEHMKEWLRDAVLEEAKEVEGIAGVAGKGDRWRIFVKLMQTIWEKSEIPQQMRWMKVLLISKVDGDFRGHMEQEPLFEAFIDLRKAYDAMDREICMDILVGYGVGPNMLRLIKHFWDTALLVCRAVGYYGGPFQDFCGVTQGGPLSPRIFNMMVDAVV